MTKVVVTGGSGFLGSHIAETLTAKGYEVTIFDTRPSPYLKPGQEMIVGSILDKEAVEAAFEGSSYIYHLAALADLNAARERPLDTAQLNVVGTVNCLEAARKTAVERFLFASTVYVYSRAGSFYRCSKQACEAYIEEYQRQYGLSYTVLRFGSLYGPHADDSNGVYRLLRQAVKGRIRHNGTPNDRREYIHVQDAARLSVQALEERYANQNLVLTGNHPMRLEELFTMFSEILGRNIDIEYLASSDEQDDSHYRITPYAFSPRVGRKLTETYYVDMGQGLLQMLDQLYQEGHFDQKPE
ncbi:MAG: NAD(P)-dependent oxidoreductase [Candidatus Promineifilaceae bacterium]